MISWWAGQPSITRERPLAGVECMSTALKFAKPVSGGKAARRYPQRARQLTALPNRAPVAAPVAFPAQRSKPVWLALLTAGQWISGGFAALAVVGAVVTYALVVDTNRQLSTSARTLETLAQQQRRLTAASAVFQNHSAQTAPSAPDAVPPHPREVIFLEAETAPAAPEGSLETESSSPVGRRAFPKGY